MSETEEIIALIRHWQEYKSKGFIPEFAGFGKWLSQHYNKDNALQWAGPIDAVLSYRLAVLFSFTDKWSRLAFEAIPVRSLNDYAILKNISETGEPTKKQVAHDALLEMSTAMEIIKRMKRDGFLKEKTDPSDKRSRRVMLTTKGKALVHTLDQQLIRLSSLLVGSLDEKSKASMLQMTEKLIAFHTNLHNNMPKEGIKTSYGL